MSVRIRRLQAEYERLKVIFDGHAYIRIAETSGQPPTRYIVEYHIKGLVEEHDEIRVRELHRAEISLGMGYPRELPRCIMLTPVFHPNIDHLAICTEDIGSAGQTLDQTIIFIGEMITFQAYNLQSPRNGDAARWTKENQARLPLDNIDLIPPVLLQGGTEIKVAAAAAATLKESQADAPELTSAALTTAPAAHAVRSMTDAGAPASEFDPAYCGNCGQASPPTGLIPCAQQHLTCSNCRLPCSNCRTDLCGLCRTRACAHCQQLFCEDCSLFCTSCRACVCLTHARPCDACMGCQCLSHINAAGLCAGCAAPVACISAADARM